MRAGFILAGAALIQKFHWVIYLFGAFLVFTGVKLLAHREGEIHPERNPVLRLFRRVVRAVPDYRGARFAVKEDGPLVRHAAAHGPGRRGGDGHRVRGGLDPRDLRHHHRPVHRLHVQHLRHPRAASPLLPARGDDRQVPVPQGGSRAGAGFRRRQDAARWTWSRCPSPCRSASSVACSVCPWRLRSCSPERAGARSRRLPVWEPSRGSRRRHCRPSLVWPGPDEDATGAHQRSAGCWAPLETDSSWSNLSLLAHRVEGNSRALPARGVLMPRNARGRRRPDS